MKGNQQIKNAIRFYEKRGWEQMDGIRAYSIRAYGIRANGKNLENIKYMMR